MTAPDPALVAEAMTINRPRLMAVITSKSIQDAIKAVEAARK